MTYIPTKEELEELGFEITHSFNNTRFVLNDLRIYIYSQKVVHYYIRKLEGDYQVFPKSLDDIRTLIRLLTPQ